VTVAQLSVKLGIDGMAQIAGALDKVKSGLGQVAEKAKSTGASLANIGAVGIAGGIAGTVAGFGMLGKNAFDAAVSFESLNSRLTAITGSGQKAASILDMVRKVAGPSPFTFSQLADLAVGLESIGLETNALLPRLANLGAAFGADEEHLKSLLNMVGKFKVGQMPDAEQMAMFGMSRSQFAKEGIKFDKGGGLDPGQELKVFETFIKIIDTKYSTMLDMLSGDTSTKLASLADAWEGAMRTIGQKLITILTPYIKYATDFLGRMMDSGILADLTEKFFKPMTEFTKGFTDGNVQKSVDQLLASILAVGASIPDIISGTFKNIGIMMQNFLDNLNAAFGRLNPLEAAKGHALIDQLKTEYIYGRISKEQLDASRKSIEQRYGFNATGSIMEGVDFGKPFADAQTFAQTILGKMAGSKAPETGAPPKPFGPYFKPGEEPGMGGTATSQTDDLLLRIADNTKTTADALTLRRETLGGGTMGALGLTGAEVGAVNASYGRFGNGIIPAGTDFERSMRRLIRDESRRNGQPGVMGRF
jgi:hypothetical protein